MGSHWGVLTATMTLSKTIHFKKYLSNYWEYMKGQEKNEVDQKETIRITQVNNDSDEDQNHSSGCGKCSHIKDIFLMWS